MSKRTIEGRHGFAGASRAWGAGHVGAPHVVR
jgi:hypothetical protein